ncbi:MAG: flagellar basal body rod protein FlgC, partial [Desulfohalobiaceae bacterium]|nr:flagellar basal body rod protein FlgC [Desulfohalobiaceae bacterium]
MDILGSMNIGSSALKAQTIRMNVISSNLANMETTRTPEGGPYKKKSVLFTSAETGFSKELEIQSRQRAQGVKVEQIVSDPREGKKVYDPSHPDADGQGFVEKPNINLVEEMTDMMKAKGSYEANVTSIKAAQRM